MNKPTSDNKNRINSTNDTGLGSELGSEVGSDLETSVFEISKVTITEDDETEVPEKEPISKIETYAKLDNLHFLFSYFEDFDFSVLENKLINRDRMLSRHCDQIKKKIKLQTDKTINFIKIEYHIIEDRNETELTLDEAIDSNDFHLESIDHDKICNDFLEKNILLNEKEREEFEKLADSLKKITRDFEIKCNKVYQTALRKSGIKNEVNLFKTALNKNGKFQTEKLMDRLNRIKKDSDLQKNQ